jgi:hypothetical protein
MGEGLGRFSHISRIRTRRTSKWDAVERYGLKLRIALFSSDCTSKTVKRRVICRMS